MKSGFILLSILLGGAAPITVLGSSARGGCGEGFDNVSTLTQRGWIFKNNSQALGTNHWFQGIPTRFPAHAGADNSYLSADKDSAGGSFPVVSNWAITPVITFQSGMGLQFYTRSAGGAGSAADRLQVLYCLRGPGVSCKDPGTGSGSMQNYNELMWINVNADPDGYPTTWTSYIVGAGQGLPGSGSGRIAFRYYNLWQEPNDWGSTIGIDSISVGGDPCALTDTLFYSGLQMP